MKPFKTIEEQIEILKSRNLKFKDEEKAKKTLLHNNYYNLINNFSKFLSKNDKYNDNVYFENILTIENFDKELKVLLFKFIIEIEKQFKSIVMYNYCKVFENNNFSYMNINNYSKYKTIDAGLLIGEITTVINKQIKLDNNNSVKHYYNKYNNVPLWVISNYLTFGQFVKFFNTIDDSLKNKIALELNELLSENLNIKSKLHKEAVSSFLENIREIRNTVAHNNRLIYFTCKRNTKYNKYLHKNKPNVQRQDLYNVILTFKCFLTKQQFKDFNNNLVDIIKEFKTKLNNDIYYTKVIDSLGVPLSLEKI